MSTNFVIHATGKPDRFQDNVSMGDVITYAIDFTPWQEENSTITSVTWTAESGQATIAGEALTSGVASANVTVSESGKSLVSVRATTATQKKKVWLEIKAKDINIYVDDYGTNDE